MNPELRRQSQRRILLVAATFFVPFIIAVVLYLAGWRPTATNHGQLVQPPRSLGAPLVTPVNEGAKPVPLKQFYGKWLLVVVGDHGCATPACRSALYKVRAAALFQGDNAHRVRRLLVLQAAPSAADLQEWRDQFAGTHILVTSAGVFSQLEGIFAAGSIAPGTVYVVDPLGNWMMWYRPTADAREMREDLSRLLAVSQIG